MKRLTTLHANATTVVPVDDHRATERLHAESPERSAVLRSRMEEVVQRLHTIMQPRVAGKMPNKISVEMALQRQGSLWDLHISGDSKLPPEGVDLGLAAYPELQSLVQEPRSVQDVLDAFCEHPHLGGNGVNYALSQVATIRAINRLNHPQNTELTIQHQPDIAIPQQLLITPETGHIAAVMQDIRGECGQWLQSLSLPGIQGRRGLHLPVNGDVMMINSMPPTPKAMSNALRSVLADVPDGAEVVVPDDYPAAFSQQRHYPTLQPTSKVIDQLQPDALRRNTFHGNDRELADIVGDLPGVETDILLPDVLRDDLSVDTIGLRATNHTIQAIWGEHVFHDRQGDRRLATVSRRQGGQIAIHAQPDRSLLAVETSLPSDAGRRELLQILGDHRVSLDIEQCTGRGDNAAAASVLDSVVDDLLERIVRDRGFSPMTAEQHRIAALLAPEILARVYATFIHHSMDSHLLYMDPENLLPVIVQVTEESIRLAQEQQDRPISSEPLAMESRWGTRTALWRVE